MRTLLTALTCLILFTTPVVAEDCKRSYSENNIVIKSVASERRTFSDEQLITAMADNPILIQRPIILANGIAVIGRPPESILDLV